MKCPIVLTSSAILALAAGPVLAIDGGTAAAPVGGGASSSYYEEAAKDVDAGASVSVSSGADARVSVSSSARGGSGAGGLPTALHVVEAAGGVEYRSDAPGAWEVAVTVAERPHERVDAVYDLVLALALPEGGGSDAWRIGVREGSRRASAAAVYAGEKVSLKRNVPLEASWLPLLVGAPEGLPDLAGSGYEWTLWDTIVRYDASAGSTVQGFATLRFAADPSLEAPDPEDPRSAAYVITWIPALGASVPPFTLRLDVAAPGKE
jgi:hypothetical protein